VSVKVGAADTDGAYTFMELTVPPGSGTPLHRHPQTETFRVLDGEFAILRADGSETSVGAGDVVQIPGSEPHGYRNTGESTGHLLAVLLPGGLEELFYELGTPADGATEPAPLTGPPDFEHLAAVSAKHHVEIVAPG
jgi:quercetin dioxygenase-like cupin family protein